MEGVFDNLARVGATVFVEDDARVKGDHLGFVMARARLARERGIRYFRAIYSAGLANRGLAMNAPDEIYLFDLNGYIKLERVLTPDQVDLCNRAIDHHLETEICAMVERL